MSNTATLMVRLRVGLMASAAFVRGNSAREVRMTDAIDALEAVEASIAELEAERDRMRAELTLIQSGYGKLVAERDRLKDALRPFAQIADKKAFQYDDWSQLPDYIVLRAGVTVGALRAALAALSGEGVT